MKNLWVEIKVLDYDLETIGFDLNVLNPETKIAKSTSFVRMSLDELRVFVDALKTSAANINLTVPNNFTDKTKFNRSLRKSNDKLPPSQDLMKQEIAEEVTKISRS
jgi:hypothetical protein